MVVMRCKSQPHAASVEAPKKKQIEAVGAAWFSSWLPDAASAEKPDDCFNILHEGDWRAYKQDCFALEQYYKDQHWDPEWSYNVDGSAHPAASHWWEGKRADGVPRHFPNWLRKAPEHIDSVDLSTLANNWFRNTHCIATAAHRWVTEERPQGSGELICFAWKACNQGVPGMGGVSSTHYYKPARWNGFWGITTRCARKMLEIRVTLPSSCLK